MSGDISGGTTDKLVPKLSRKEEFGIKLISAGIHF